MKVSVVMATYGGEEYIVEQLDSICVQLKAGDELIICDDCSKDATVKVIREYIAKNGYEDLIRLYENEQNLGFQNNFNKALSYANGDLIFFADQDDIWKENKIETMTKIMEEKEDCLLLCCDYEPFRFTEDAPEIPAYIKEKMPDNGKLEKVEQNKDTIYIGALGCCMCLRKEFQTLLEKYWFDGWAQDDRCWRMALVAGGLYVIHSNLVRHRLHGNNTATYGKYHTIEKRTKLFDGMQQADLCMMQYLKDKNDNNMESEKVSKEDKAFYGLLSRNEKMLRKRIELLKHRKFGNCFSLIGDLKYYQAKKSYLVEALMAVKNK